MTPHVDPVRRRSYDAAGAIPAEALACINPDRVLWFEPLQASMLEWMPVCVRYKLDDCRLKVRLVDWQCLTPMQRQAMVCGPAGETFRRLVLRLVPGATELRMPAAALPYPRHVMAKFLESETKYG